MLLSEIIHADASSIATKMDYALLGGDVLLAGMGASGLKLANQIGFIKDIGSLAGNSSSGDYIPERRYNAGRYQGTQISIRCFLVDKT